MNPHALVAYAHSDNKDGFVDRLRAHLTTEVQQQTGEDFDVFQDRRNILPGENWKDRIKASISEVMFLAAVLTPSFFRSPECREEVQAFLEREMTLARNDLIIPIYYISCSLFESPSKRSGDWLAQTLSERQYVDWHQLRFASINSIGAKRKLEEIAARIKSTMECLSLAH